MTRLVGLLCLVILSFSARAQELVPYQILINGVYCSVGYNYGSFGAGEAISITLAGNARNPETKIVCVQLKDVQQINGGNPYRIVSDTLYFPANSFGSAERKLTFSSRYALSPRQETYSLYILISSRAAPGERFNAQFIPFFIVSSPPVATQPLPVQLTTFTGKVEGEQVALRWTTAQEKNTAYFEVETSIDGNAYATAGRVQAAGTTTQLSTYNYRVPFVTDWLYARLRTVDLDASFSYSPVLVFQQSHAATTDFLVHRGDHYFRYTLPAGAIPLTIYIYDTVGRLLTSQPAQQTELPTGGVVVVLTSQGLRYGKLIP